MTNEQKPPREFWLIDIEDGHRNAVTIKPQCDAVRVIEYSAYEKVCNELAGYAQYPSVSAFEAAQIKLESENAELRKELDLVWEQRNEFNVKHQELEQEMERLKPKKDKYEIVDSSKVSEELKLARETSEQYRKSLK